MPKPKSKTTKSTGKTREPKNKTPKSGSRTRKPRTKTIAPEGRTSTQGGIGTPRALNSAAVIAAGIVVVLGYLLFNFYGQLHTNNEHLNQLSKETQQLNDGAALIQILDKGGLKSDSDLRQLGFAFTRLSELSASQPMDSDYVTQTSSWCDDYQNRLVQETGQISKYQFTDAALRKNQTSIVNLYQSFSEYLGLVCNSISNWNNLSVEGRNGQLVTINDSRSKVIVILAQMQANALRGGNQLQSLRQKNQQQVERYSAQSKAITASIIASWIGIILGLAFLGFVLARNTSLKKKSSNK